MKQSTPHHTKQMTTTTTHTGQENARAKLASIEAIYELYRFGVTYQLEDKKPVGELSAEATELLTDEGLELDGLTTDEINDVVWQACRAECLGVDYSATWSKDCDHDGSPDSFKIWLSIGGPSCWVRGDFSLHSIDADSLRFCFSWASADDFLWLRDIEREALAWFAEEVAG